MINIIFQNPFHVEAVTLKYRHHHCVFRQHISFEGIDVIFTCDGGQPLDEFGADTLFLEGIENDKGDFRGFRSGR